MGRRSQRLKIAILNLVVVALLFGIGYLVFENVGLRTRIDRLKETVAQLESERRELVERATVATSVANHPQDQAALRLQIERRTSELRELEFKEPVTYRSLSRDELHSVLVKLAEEQYTPEELRRYSRALAAFGVVPAGTDLLKLWLGMYGEQIGAFYVPEEHALYTFNDLALSGGIDRMMLAHELTHALQDQNFNLADFPIDVKDNDDLALATSALIEGDATVLMTQFYADQFDRSTVLDDLGAMLSQKTENLAKAPPFLRELLLFPYQQGQKFAMSLFARGGMAELNRALARPPTSTEQVLHPDRYMGEPDVPTPITLPDASVEGWSPIWENVLGEFGIRSMLTIHTRFALAQLAAAGWDGDRYRVFERGTEGPTAVVWLSVWDTQQDAVEFIDAYRGYLKARGIKDPLLKRERIYVTVVFSSDPDFVGKWQAATAP